MKYAARSAARRHYDGRVVRTVKRITALAGAALGVALYAWYEAVRAVPEVKRRKAALRAGVSLRRTRG